jgi:hypothetical protein
MLLKGRKELCFLSVAWCSPTEPIPSDSRHCHTQPTSHGERRLQQAKRKVSLTEIVSEMREICQADDQLIPPIIIVDLWPISVPSSTPRQTFPFSCKSPMKTWLMNPEEEMVLKMLLAVLVNLHWWSNSFQEKLWMFLGSRTIFSGIAVPRAWTVPSHHLQTWGMCNVEVLLYIASDWKTTDVLGIE